MENPSKLIYLCDEYPGAVSRFGGIGVSMQSEAEWFARQGADVDVICQTDESKPGAATQRGVNVHVLPSSRLPKARALLDRFRAARYVQRLAGTGDPVVICADYTGPMAFKPFPQPLVVQMHGCATLNAAQQGRQAAALTMWFERRTYSLADGVQSCSSFTARATIAALELGERDVEIIPNPADTSLFRPAPDSVIPGDILFVGKFNRLKGVPVLAEAIPTVLREAPAARLIMVGQDTFEDGGSVRARFLAGIPEDLRPRLEIVDRLSRAEVADRMRRAGVLVLPSETEAFPMVVVEAMASGRPVVASNRGGIPEAVCDGVTGILADPDRPPAFTKALLGLIREPARAHALGEAGRMRAVEKFSPERVYERTRSLHDAVRARASGRADLRWTAKWLPN